MPRKGRSQPYKIYQRFHFASALKRMSVICGHTSAGSVDTEYMATVKGAPETLRAMVNDTHAWRLVEHPTCVLR